MEIKKKGQVFTPQWVVTQMLDMVGYSGVDILKRHVMDNSCGEGAFLSEAVRRYCVAAARQGISPIQTRKDLQEYVHGIDIDPGCCLSCMNSLDAAAKEHGIAGVKWNIVCGDTITVGRQFYGYMDYVVGNPPYVSIQNIYRYDVDITGLDCTFGNTDLYMAFMEIGLLMLNKTGRMAVITPSIWMKGESGRKLRKMVLVRKWLKAVVSIGHLRVFGGITTFTAISVFSGDADYHASSGHQVLPGQVELLVQHRMEAGAYRSLGVMPYECCVIDWKIYVASRHDLVLFRNIILHDGKKRVRVRNGFATLADKVFIGNEIPDSRYNIRAVKASTGKWTKCFFPYDRAGDIIGVEDIKGELDMWSYLAKNRERLDNRKSDSQVFYAFGRSQGVRDVFREKISVACVVRGKDDLKITMVPPGTGVYGGLYILRDEGVSGGDIERALSDGDFDMFVRILGKHKNGRYFCFSSYELETFLNYKLESTTTTKC